MVQSQRVTDLAAPPFTGFQPEPWQMGQTVDEEVTEEILKKFGLVVRLYYAGRRAASEQNVTTLNLAVEVSRTSILCFEDPSSSECRPYVS